MGHGRHLTRFIRDTNLLERTFVEVRRRTKVIGRFPGETSALSLIWAVLELSSRGWRGVVMTPATTRGAIYVDVVCFGGLAESVGEYLTNGRQVAVSGRLESLNRALSAFAALPVGCLGSADRRNLALGLRWARGD